MTSTGDHPPKESQQGLLSFMVGGNGNKQNNNGLISTFINQSQSENENSNNKRTSTSLLNLGDSLKTVTQILHDSISKSSRSQEPSTNKAASSDEPKQANKKITLNIGDSLNNVTKILQDSLSKSARPEVHEKDQKQAPFLNIGDSLKDAAKIIHESISKSSRPEEKQSSTLNLDDSLKDVSKVIQESLSQSSRAKNDQSQPLNLGDPLQNATKVIHDSIKNYPSSNEEQNSNVGNILQDTAKAINNFIQKESTNEEKSEVEAKADEESKKDEEREDQKGKLEQYIEDEILITMVNSPHHKLTAETQTDADLYGEEESSIEEEEEQKEENDMPPITMTKYSDEELYEALQKQLTTHQLPPYEMREPLIDYARKQSIFRLMEEDYDKASKIDEAVAANLQSLRDDHHNIEADMLNSHLKHRLSEAERSKSSLQDEWKRKIRSFKENEQNELQKINERHEQERRLFENHWSQAAILMPFSKPSSSLLQLRSMQKAFALSHDFVNAKQLKITAEKKQKEESIEASKKATKSMKKEYITLLNRQQNEISCFSENCNRKLGKLEQQRDFELKVNENVRSQLASRVNKSRSIKKPMVMVPMTTKADKFCPSLTAVSGQMSYRTRSQFANYRQAVDMKMLDVKIDDLHSIIKPLNPANQSNSKTSKNQKKGKGSKKT